MISVSIVISIYNMELYLHRCVDSMLMQIESNIEIILVDDGSTDSSSELCDRYAQGYPEIIRVVHKSNGGLSSARNAGMEIARGKYIIFPDPDDWVEPNYISRALELQEMYRTDLVCLGYFIDYDDCSIPTNENSKLIKMSGDEAQSALLNLHSINGFAWNKLYNLDIIRKYDLKFLDNLGTTEDLDFAFCYLQYCKSVCVDPQSRVYHYYQRIGAATHSKFSKKKLENFHTYEKIINRAHSNLELVQAAKEEICNEAINLIPLYFDSDIRYVDDYIKIRNYIKLYFKDYLKSKRYGIGRKIQSILARFIPSLYWIFKNQISKRKR